MIWFSCFLQMHKSVLQFLKNKPQTRLGSYHYPTLVCIVGAGQVVLLDVPVLRCAREQAKFYFERRAMAGRCELDLMQRVVR